MTAKLDSVILILLSLCFNQCELTFAVDTKYNKWGPKFQRERNVAGNRGVRRFGNRSYNQRRPTSNRIRRLQETDECLNLPGSNFTQQILGPSYDEDSLYNNVEFYSVITGFTPIDDELVTLPINTLADVLLEDMLVITGTYPFDQTTEYFGRNGEYTEELLFQHQLLIDFWQVNSNSQPILLIGLHAVILQPEGNLEMAVGLLSFRNEYQNDVSITDAVLEVASSARNAIETELPEGYSNYDLTSNDGYFSANFGVIGYENSSVIVIGDGALQFDVSLGHGTTGNDVFHAHEFGHALQHIIDLEDFDGDYDAYIEFYEANLSPEVSRYSELEADAFAAYFLAHKQGRDFPLSLLLQTTRSAFAIGDCSYDSDDHHGSPKQRECATKWGADEGLDMTGTPLTPREFRTLFSQSYDLILALDSSVCQLTDDIGDSTENSTVVTPTLSPIAMSNPTRLTPQPTFPLANDMLTSKATPLNSHVIVNTTHVLVTTIVCVLTMVLS